ncbi:MAG: bifunctional glutamate N-acetyltransferase/amino-acid acetyltransferase ArgJ [Deltaproteobacteria bacterium]|nr:bifunctional glutamate N-acetyltransferase/amino-acid acetyltransferase ArgJ [Deltaproteobacteria bacterium]
MDKTELTIPGFKASAVAAGIKKGKALDLAMIVSDQDTTAAAVFTTNKVKAAPVILSMEHIRDSRVGAVIVNSGNANACTGKEGMDKARLTAELVAKELGIAPEEVIVASTGVIGATLDMDLFKKAIPDLAKGLAPDGIQSAARAIMTTDSFPKISRFEGEAGGKTYQILGIAKGAGMIMPDMATMLCFIVSDIRIEASELQRALLSATETSFNRITVDGDTSTNDMVLVMANGMAGNDGLDADDREGFLRGLKRVMTELATMIVRDGEGATKVVYVTVKGAASGADALIAARTIADSSLVKTAFYGQDPNWGRIMAALGRSDIFMKEEEVTIWIDDVRIVENGLGLGADPEERAAEQMKNKEFTLTVDLRQGDHEDRITTCDLTHEYVSINADYRT